MSHTATTRRKFLKTSSSLVAVSTLAAAATTRVHAAESNTIQLALVGCGGRGTGAAVDALHVKNGPLKLVAMADVFPARLKSSYENIHAQFAPKVEVPEDRKFIGFEAYKQAIDALNPGDIAIFATPPAFRWVHFKYAIEKGVNVFMEKPVAVDGPSTRRMLELGVQSVAKNLKVGVGLMCRHCVARGDLFNRVQNGELGDIIAMRSYRMHPPVGSAFSTPKPEGISELMYQVQRFHSFLWASGGCYSDFYIHNLDECCWIKNAWPVEAKASGGRHFRGNFIDQNFDSYSVEYTFADGSKLFHSGRTMAGCHDEFASYAHGSKGLAVISSAGHWPSHAAIYKGQHAKKDDLVWSYGAEKENPYRKEWEDLVAAIRDDKPYNEVKRGAEASLVTAMGRMAAHTGQVVTFDDMLHCEHEFAPKVDELTLEGPAPLLADANGKYPVPLPGINSKREY